MSAAEPRAEAAEAARGFAVVEEEGAEGEAAVPPASAAAAAAAVAAFLLLLEPDLLPPLEEVEGVEGVGI